MAGNIVSLNINAILALNEYRINDAISLLRTALRSTGALLTQASQDSQNAQAHAKQKAPAEQTICCISLTGTARSFSGDPAGFAFFNRAFTIASSQDHDRLALIILFNLAVAHHNNGISTGSSGELNFALKYYAMALDLIHHIVTKSRIDDLLLLALAICNNMGNIYLHFFDIKETVKCTQWMENLMECCNVSSLEEEDYAFFNLNLLVSPQRQLSISPAA